MLHREAARLAGPFNQLEHDWHSEDAGHGDYGQNGSVACEHLDAGKARDGLLGVRNRDRRLEARHHAILDGVACSMAPRWWFTATAVVAVGCAIVRS